MYDLFYIVEVKPQWYNLIVNGIHYCISCGSDLEVLKRTLYNYVRTLKTKDRVYRVIRGTDNRGKVCPSTYAQRKQDYDSGKHMVFNDLVREVVAQALKDSRKDSPYHKTKKKVKAVVHTPPTEERTITPAPTQEVRVVKKITPRKITRTTA